MGLKENLTRRPVSRVQTPTKAGAVPDPSSLGAIENDNKGPSGLFFLSTRVFERGAPLGYRDW